MKQPKFFSRDVILIFAACFFYMCCPTMVNSIIVGFTETVGGSGFIMGFVGGLLSLASLFCRPFAGNLADRINKARLSLIGSGLMVLACLCYLIATSPWLLVIGRILHGVGYSFCSVCMTTWFSLLIPKEKIGFGMGLYGTFQALGLAISPYFGIRLADSLGYRAAFGVAAILAVFTLAATLLIQDPGEPSPSNASSRSLQLIEPSVVPIALIISCFAIPYSATQTFLVSFVAHSGSPVHADVFFPLYAVVLIALRLGLRNFFDRVPYHDFLFLGAASAAAAMLLLSSMNGYFQMFLAAAFMAGGYGIMCSVSQAEAIHISGKEKRGLANSTYYIGFDLGLALGPMVGGVLYENLDIGLFYPSFLVCSALPLLVYAICHKKMVHAYV